MSNTDCRICPQNGRKQVKESFDRQDSSVTDVQVHCPEQLSRSSCALPPTRPQFLWELYLAHLLPFSCRPAAPSCPSTLLSGNRLLLSQKSSQHLFPASDRLAMTHYLTFKVSWGVRHTLSAIVPPYILGLHPSKTSLKFPAWLAPITGYRTRSTFWHFSFVSRGWSPGLCFPLQRLHPL